ncbi:hypothetical protein [Aquibacillus salsiterrae]|uniref:Uncharacterized protein n=1 Tax=Aquibacillus salsiterrae TaxID=2950439 RepID=A0A9X3WH88_9BACI|nr:hypothetical protein [Aquibacillus salsiterrae]MDC3417394.1 hypothetical protein [Aquibacillus salsiterrae]
MDKHLHHNVQNTSRHDKKTKAFEEISEEIRENPELKKMRPSIQPKDIEEIDY